MGVYFDDLDAFGILHNARYLLLFERTLGSFWEGLGIGQPDRVRAKEGGEGDHWHLVRANHIDYLRPVRGSGRIRVRIHVQTLGTTSMTIGFRLLPMDHDEDFATGHRVLVCVDPSTQRPVPWSDRFRALMAPWLVQP